MTYLPDPKTTTPRSKEHLQWVAGFGCCVCGLPSDAHHAAGKRGTGIKPSDFAAIPICRLHHAELHHVGQQAFEAEHGIQLMEVLANVLHIERTGQTLTLHLERIAA